MLVCKQVYVLDAQASGSDALACAIQAKMPDWQVSLYTSEHELMRQLARGLEPDVILYDVLASGVSGMLGLKYLSARFPAVKLIALCGADGWTGGEVLRQLVVSATLSRMSSVDSMVANIRQVMAEGRQHRPRPGQDRSRDEGLWRSLDMLSGLSPKRYRALLMIAEGRLNKEIAWEIRATESTVKAMVTSFLKMFQVRTRTELAVMLARLELRFLLGVGLHTGAGEGALRVA